MRNVQKALLFALLQPSDKMKKLQDEANMTELMVLSEEFKTMPFGDVWEKYLEVENVKADYLTEIKEYEKKVLVNR